MQSQIFNQSYHLSESAIPLAPGQKIRVFVRPESIELKKEIGEEQLKGLITEKTFLGEKIDYQMKIDGHSLNATSYDPFLHEIFAVNQGVGIILNEHAIKILAKKII